MKIAGSLINRRLFINGVCGFDGYIGSVSGRKKEQVWDAIHTAVELQRQVLKDGTETLMPEDMAQYMSANDLDYDMTGGDRVETGS